MVALLEALEKDQAWLSVTVEPDDPTEKTDIRFVYPENKIKAIQVKSSVNPFEQWQLEKWAGELASAAADTHELVLVGLPINEKVATCKSVGRVTVRLESSELSALTQRAAFLLLRFLEEQGLPQQNTDYLKMVVGSLVTKLAMLSTKARSLTAPNWSSVSSEGLLRRRPSFRSSTARAKPMVHRTG